MNKILICQNIIATISSFTASLISFVYVFNEKVDFMIFSSQQKIAYCSLIILWLITFLTCIYSIFYMFGKCMSCCWKIGNSSNDNLSLNKGCSYLIGLVSFCILVFFMWYQPLNFAKHLIIAADILMSNVVFVFTIVCSVIFFIFSLL